jgi:uncharacterized membrane protein
VESAGARAGGNHPEGVMSVATARMTMGVPNPVSKEKLLSTLVAIAYDDLDQANQVMGTIGQLVKEHSLSVEDAVVVEHKADGKLKLHQPSMTGLGAASGALWGGVIGMLFLMPLFGMAIGAATGAAAGAGSDYGVDDQFVKDLGEKLPAGGAAVLVLVAEATRDKVVPEIAKFGGHVIQSSLSNEQQDALQQALDARGATA